MLVVMAIVGIQAGMLLLLLAKAIRTQCVSKVQPHRAALDPTRPAHFPIAAPSFRCKSRNADAWPSPPVPPLCGVSSWKPGSATSV
jgi:hypothetical protein